MNEKYLRALYYLNKNQDFSGLSLEQLIFEAVRCCGIEDVYEYLESENFKLWEDKYKKLDKRLTTGEK